MAKIDDEQLKEFEFVKSLNKDEALTSCTAAQLHFILQHHFDVTMPKSSKKAKLVAKIEELQK